MRNNLEDLIAREFKNKNKDQNSSFQKRLDKRVDNWIKVRNQEKKAERALTIKNKMEETLDRKLMNGVRNFN